MTARSAAERQAARRARLAAAKALTAEQAAAQRAEAVQAGLPLAPVADQEALPSAAPGRPAGSVARKTAEWQAFMLGRYRSPLVVMAEVFSRSLVELAAAEPNADVLQWKPGDAMPADVAAAEARAAELAKEPTDAIATPEREALRDQAINNVVARRLAEIGGAPAVERKALIVIGPPSAGKSTVIEPLAKQMKALLIDSDDLKGELPEFEGGIGAMRVHEESSKLSKQLIAAATSRGENIALPLVGDNPEKVRGLIEALKARGYTVTLALNDLPIGKAAQRNMLRFRETGRLVGLDHLTGIGSKPRDAYMSLRSIADEHAQYSNDVPRGAPPLYQGGTRDLLGDQQGAAGREPGRSAAGPADRGGDPGTGRGAGFTPREEAYLNSQAPPENAALRMEGELRHRLDRLRRAIGRVGQQAVRQDIRRLEDFEAQWVKKAAELEAFAARIDQRAKARAAANLADRFDWEPRVRRVLDDTRREVELAFRRFYADEMLASTLEPDAQLRRFLYRGTQPGTAPGEALRAIALFKSFPVAYAQRVLAAAVHGYRPGERGRQAAHAAGLIAISTLLGYLGMTAKDAVRGYAPRDPTSHKTWLAAMAQGGGIGIYGDFLFGQGSRFGNSVLETVAGPALGGAANLIGIWQRAKQGDAKAGDALGVVLREAPFVNLWWARPVLDALILNELREWASPGTLRRQARTREQDYGQERWAPESVWR